MSAGADRPLDPYDIRLKRLKANPHFIIINNYKCGFSSSNMLAFLGVHEINPDDEVIFFYRSPFLRAISVFINWLITDDRYRREEGWLIENLGAHLGAQAYKRFLNQLQMEDYADALGTYVQALESIAELNDHTRPQSCLLQQYDIWKLDHFIELENNTAFRTITGLEFPTDQKNVSAFHIKSSLVRCLESNSHLRQRLRSIYQQDFDFFDENGLECSSWRGAI